MCEENQTSHATEVPVKEYRSCGLVTKSVYSSITSSLKTETRRQPALHRWQRLQVSPRVLASQEHRLSPKRQKERT